MGSVFSDVAKIDINPRRFVVNDDESIRIFCTKNRDEELDRQISITDRRQGTLIATRRITRDKQITRGEIATPSGNFEKPCFNLAVNMTAKIQIIEDNQVISIVLNECPFPVPVTTILLSAHFFPLTNIAGFTYENNSIWSFIHKYIGEHYDCLALFTLTDESHRIIIEDPSFSVCIADRISK